jgi:hypothetical protein
MGHVALICSPASLGVPFVQSVDDIRLVPAWGCLHVVVGCVEATLPHASPPREGTGRPRGRGPKDPLPTWLLWCLGHTSLEVKGLTLKLPRGGAETPSESVLRLRLPRGLNVRQDPDSRGALVLACPGIEVVLQATSPGSSEALRLESAVEVGGPRCLRDAMSAWLLDSEHRWPPRLTPSSVPSRSRRRWGLGCASAGLGEWSVPARI